MYSAGGMEAEERKEPQDPQTITRADRICSPKVRVTAWIFNFCEPIHFLFAQPIQVGFPMERLGVNHSVVRNQQQHRQPGAC